MSPFNGDSENQTAYAIIAKVNGLFWIKDNIFCDKDYNHYYLDKFGFHNTNQFSNYGIEVEKQRIKELIKQKEAMNEFIEELIDAGKVSRTEVRKKIESKKRERV